MNWAALLWHFSVGVGFELGLELIREFRVNV